LRVLVTGGGGFLGRAIVQQLLARGDDVRIVARGDYPDVRAMGARTHRGDLADAAVARAATEGCEAVVHTAAKAGAWGDYEAFRQSNVVATQNVVDACRETGVGRLVFTGSPSVTFDGSDHENAGPDTPYPDRFLSHYARTKAEAEQIALAADGDGLRVTSIRPHLIYGPGDPHLLPAVIARHIERPLRVVGDGHAIVDITYVDNAAAAHLDALDALTDDPDTPGGRAYFISDDDPVRLWDFLDELFAALDLPPAGSPVPAGLARVAASLAEGVHRALKRDGEPRFNRFLVQAVTTSHYYDMSPAREDLGYAPIVGREVALRKTIEDLRSRFA